MAVFDEHAHQLAVLGQRGGVPLGRRDCYASTVGGVRLSEPAIVTVER